jgi:hypothetical protein
MPPCAAGRHPVGHERAGLAETAAVEVSGQREIGAVRRWNKRSVTAVSLAGATFGGESPAQRKTLYRDWCEESECSGAAKETAAINHGHQRARRPPKGELRL